MPDISVIIAMRNAATTIEATLTSALAQQGVAFEVIVVDDGSTDRGDRLVEAIARRDRRVRLARQPGLGVSAARNFGIALSTAPLLAFLDADDLWAPGKLARHVALHRADPGLGASYARIAFIPEEAEEFAAARTRSSLAANPLTIPAAIGENPVCTASNFVVRRDLIPGRAGFDRAWSHAEDQELVLRLLARGARIVGIDAVLTGYRFSRGGLSMNFEKMHAGWKALADHYLDPRAKAPAEALYYRYLARRVLRSGASPRLAARFALAGIRCDAAAFLADARRGWPTLIGALAAPALPGPVRRHLFA